MSDREKFEDRCHICDRRRATDEDYVNTKPGRGEDLCWGRWDVAQCEAAEVDWRARYLALSSRDSTPTEGPVAYHKAEDDTFWIVHNGFCIAHVKNFAPDAPEALDWAQKIVNGLNGQMSQATPPTEGVGRRVVDEWLAEVDSHPEVEWDDLAALSAIVDRVAAPRMRLDLRNATVLNADGKPMISVWELDRRIRAQLPNVEVVTE